MDKNNIEIEYSRIGCDPSIRPLLSLRDTGYSYHIWACQAYSQWMKDYDEREIADFFKVSVEEIKADLEHIRSLLPEETIALNIRERDEIRAAKERSRKTHEELAKDLSLSAKVLLERGKNPATVLRRYREAVNRDLREIETLRAKDAAPIDKQAEDLTLQEDIQRISRLRNEGKKQTNLNKQLSGRATQEPDMDDAKGNEKKRKQRRLTIRVENFTLEKLQKHIENSGFNISKIIRDAIDRYLESSTEAESGSM